MKRRCGFSLIETMIAVLVLSFTVLVFGAVFPAASRMRWKGENVTRATTIAQQKLEQLRGQGYDGLTSSSLLAAGIVDASPTSSPYSITTASGLGTALPSGTGTLTITDAGTDLKQAQVDITWGGLITQGNSVTLIAYIANLDNKVVTVGP